MLKKIIFTTSFIFLGLFVTAQKNINSYKYIVVPKSFDFLKGDDQYQLNSLTKFLFNKHGYEAYFIDDKLPEDLQNDRCLALTSHVVKGKGGLFKTKIEIVLKDCFGATVMTSDIGESRLKQYDKAYNEAIRDAFQTFQNFDYKYVSAEKITAETEKSKAIALPKNEVITPNKNDTVVAKDNVVISEETLDKEETTIDEKIVTPSSGRQLYYAQETENGFQLVNSEPKIVMILLTTAAENVFLVKGKSAIVFKEDGFWYYSENDGQLGEKQIMNIKF